MTIHDKIRELKQELDESMSNQYRELLKQRIERLSHYALYGDWPKAGGQQ